MSELAKRADYFSSCDEVIYWESKGDWDFNSSFGFNPGDEVAVNAITDGGSNWGIIREEFDIDSEVDIAEISSFMPSHNALDDPFMGNVIAKAQGLACNRASHLRPEWNCDEYKDW